MWGLMQRREGSFPIMLKLSPDIWKDGLRTAVAAGITLIVSRAFNLQHGYWAVITAVVIMQSSIGASLKVATSRLVGTLAGAAFCFAVAALSLCHGRGRGSRVDVGHRTAGFSGRLLAELSLQTLGRSVVTGGPVPSDLDAYRRFAEAASNANQQIAARTDAPATVSNFSFALDEVRLSITQLTDCVIGVPRNQVTAT